MLDLDFASNTKVELESTSIFFLILSHMGILEIYLKFSSSYIDIIKLNNLIYQLVKWLQCFRLMHLLASMHFLSYQGL